MQPYGGHVPHTALEQCVLQISEPKKMVNLKNLKMKMTPLVIGLEERGTLRLEIVMSCVAKMMS